MPNPVTIPPGPLVITEADNTLAEELLSAFVQLVKSGSSGASVTTPASTVGGLNETPETAVELSSAEAQLMFRQLAVAIAKVISASGGGVTLPTFVDEEEVGAGLSGTVFTLANAPNPPTSLRVYRNGIRESGWTLGGVDGKTLTLDPTYPKDAVEDDIVVEYRY